MGYGIAYPFSMIGVVLLIQFLPRILKRDLRNEEGRWSAEKESESPGLQSRQFLITNPNCDGKKVSEVNPHRMTLANISRIKHGDQVFAASPGRILYLGDVVMVVGTPEELDKMQFLLGEETHERMDVNVDVLSVDVEVTAESLTGRRLAEMRVWERYTVVITRIRRQGLEIAPTGNVTLEMGDNIRVVGDKEAVETFVNLVHGSPRRAEETNMLPFLAGLLLGIGVGVIPINLANGVQVKLGTAGGAFLVSLIVGHFGGLGPLRLYVPAAAKNLSPRAGSDALPGRGGRQRRLELRRDPAAAGHQPAGWGRAHYHLLGAGRLAGDAPGLPDEPAGYDGRVERLHDQPAGIGRGELADRIGPAHPVVCQRLPGGVDLQNLAGAAAGGCLTRVDQVKLEVVRSVDIDEIYGNKSRKSGHIVEGSERRSVHPGLF